MNPRLPASLLLCFSLLGVRLAPAAELAMPGHPLRSIQSETLVYAVSARKGFMAFDLGTATFVLTRETVKGQAQLVVRATARGGVVGYDYDAVTTCRLSLDTLEQLTAVEYRVKPDYKSKWLRFSTRGIDYLKHKTCDVPALCRNPAHFVTNVDNTRIHVKDSEDPIHHVWSLRERHRDVKGRVYDAIGALYLARGFDASVGGKGGSIRVVSKRDMWDIQFRGKEEDTIKVPAGEIRCIRLALKTKAANAYSRKNADEFEGPFGLHGDIELYVDRETRQAVRVRGQLEFGAVVDVEVRLKSRTVTRLPNGAGPEEVQP